MSSLAVCKCCGLQFWQFFSLCLGWRKFCICPYTKCGREMGNKYELDSVSRFRPMLGKVWFWLVRFHISMSCVSLMRSGCSLAVIASVLPLCRWYSFACQASANTALTHIILPGLRATNGNTILCTWDFPIFVLRRSFRLLARGTRENVIRTCH